jgi:serine/threonine protein kinase
MIQRIGQVLGNYRITDEINSGTFGAVYKAEHTILINRTVAIKFLHAESIS